MKLHDLRPPAGSNTARTRVGRGIAAGKGKTAGRGTKGQKARAGGSIPPWFEGGQTPLHMRIPKLRGFKNRAKIEYEVVNVGAIAARVEAGAFTTVGTAPKKGEPLTINADILRAVGLVRDVKKPLKILGGGELAAALFVVAEAFTKSASAKIEAAGGSVNILEIPALPLAALGVGGAAAATVEPAIAAAAVAPASPRAARTESTKAAPKTTRPKASGPAATAKTRTDRAKATAAGPAEAGADGDESTPAADATAAAVDRATEPSDETEAESAVADRDESA
jgi:large subunit ribosomal protein L15